MNWRFFTRLRATLFTCVAAGISASMQEVLGSAFLGAWVFRGEFGTITDVGIQEYTVGQEGEQIVDDSRFPIDSPCPRLLGEGPLSLLGAVGLSVCTWIKERRWFVDKSELTKRDERRGIDFEQRKKDLERAALGAGVALVLGSAFFGKKVGVVLLVIYATVTVVGLGYVEFAKRLRFLRRDIRRVSRSSDLSQQPRPARGDDVDKGS